MKLFQGENEERLCDLFGLGFVVVVDGKMANLGSMGEESSLAKSLFFGADKGFLGLCRTTTLCLAVVLVVLDILFDNEND